ncbi:hypothetical protein D9757_006365 [Collybiopsis confluens]|uniref:RNI-like protein n=1 Tax=Collybiopsis confluens TaxID=2823264 RepID=A0A8H5HGQ2_9AGAR|nr:hypothetical protein D9757_006365 [Collybiopsis confluens]
MVCMTYWDTFCCGLPMSKAVKRQRTGRLPSFGAPSALGELETAIFQTNEPSSRHVVTGVPSLITLCKRRFVSAFKGLREKRWTLTSHQLKELPPHLAQELLRLLSRSHPGLLSNEIIVAHFLRGPTFAISSTALPGANKDTVTALPRLNAQIRDLDLTSFSSITDKTFSKVISQLHELRSLCLRKCSKVGNGVISAIVESCPHIRKLNVNETSVTPAAIARLLVARGSELEVLKLAGLERWTDATFMAQLYPVVKEEQIRMPKLQNLKLRSLQLSDPSIEFLLSLSPGLKRLDISFTQSKRPFLFISRHAASSIDPFPALLLEKLSLTSTPIASSDLLKTISCVSNLQTLSIGAVGAKGAMGVASAATLNDTTLRKLTDILHSFPNLRSINMVSNTRLGTSSQVALFSFIQQVGRKCSHLNLSGISSLRSGALAGLVPDEGMASCAVENLVLNNTGIDDEAGVYIACCPNLVTLEVEGTKLTSEVLFPVIDACPRLQVLNLTSCRGIKIADRRQFFELWESQRYNVD